MGRIGNSQLLGNQSLHGAFTRGHLSLSTLQFDLISAVLLCVGVTLAAVAYRRSSALLAVLVCAGTGLMLSPISWTHHYVWIAPVLIWLVVGVDRPARGGRWALAAAVPFIVMLPFTSNGSGVLWYVRANAYVIATMAFLAMVAIMLFLRRRTRVNDRETVGVVHEGRYDRVDGQIQTVGSANGSGSNGAEVRI